MPQYNFNWEFLYKLKDPLFIPEGTKIVVTAHFDNSAKNKYNPDPTKVVRYGNPSYDEMMVGGFDYLSAGPGRASMKLDEKLLQSYSGEYKSATGMKFNVTTKDGRLYVTAFGGKTFHLIPESESKFVLVEFDGLMIFDVDEQKGVSELTLRHNGHVWRTTKASPAATGN